MITDDDAGNLKLMQQVLLLRVAEYTQQIYWQCIHTDDDLLSKLQNTLEQLDKIDDDIAWLRAMSKAAIRIITGQINEVDDDHR